ncbi:MAG: iolG 14 [Armatimonadetes bacterium]|nr:iolG 14 [Armatimonadota bacterium]
MNRRDFVKSTAVGAGIMSLGAEAFQPRSVRGASEKVTLAVVGLNSRGSQLCSTLVGLEQAEIAYQCDVDERVLPKAQDLVEKKGRRRPDAARDFRKLLENPSIDAIVVAAPNHWHGPMTILACQAGKHVYCEKPASHTPQEGELMIAAARKHNRIVQCGMQRRSMPGIQEAVQKLRDGAIGNVTFARGWYNNLRPTIGNGKPAAVPSGLDYALWQGPAPEMPYKDNLIHYNWHWFWHWGNGELGNNGPHCLDVCRWGLGVDYPTRVSSGGGKYRFPGDDQQTPDTHTATFDFEGKSIAFEARSFHKRGFEDNTFGMAFYGEGGTLLVEDGGYRILDMNNKEVAKVPGSSNQAPHLQNFLDCVKSGKRPNQEIEDGHKSTMLCLLGNIAYRTESTLKCDPKNGHILNNKQAMDNLWSREYRKGWEPKV